MSISAILACRGAEYKAVCKGVSQVASPPAVLPISMGPAAAQQAIASLHQPTVLPAGSSILIMGLCGSLNPRYRVGDVVVYRDCIDATEGAEGTSPRRLVCDRHLTQQLCDHLEHAALVTAVTYDRVVHAAEVKRTLGKTYDAAAVDMEGFAILEALQAHGVAVGMMRVVSDDCEHALPDLTSAISTSGTLLPLPMTTAMLRQPVAAIRLIRGSLQGLAKLEQTVATLFR